MQKEAITWRLSTLWNNFNGINFPEYQREPNIWSLDAKRRLIDSILREFDIAPVYFYENEDGGLDCIDGRQRINTIMAFFGENESDKDNGFIFQVKNELYRDVQHPFDSLDGLTYRGMEQRRDEGDECAALAIRTLSDYELMVVQLSGAAQPEEFNLQFARLNLGMVINAGEKLNAMVGTMRDICFDDPRIGKHPFLDTLSIPFRRFAKEQVAAQILAQVFSLAVKGAYAKARHFDLQRFFKDYVDVDPADQRIEQVRMTFDVLNELFRDQVELRNRAIAVTAVLVAWRRGFFDGGEGRDEYPYFLREFLCRLHWQIGKGLDIDAEYRYLTDFQRYVTQASVERPAVEGRSTMLEAAFARWLREHDIRGDGEYRDRTGRDPGEECRGGNAT